MRFALSTVSALAVASVALGQEYPDPNPVPQADGTNLWYVGNNTQYPVIQDVLDAISDGDEVVVREGLYVESLHIDNSDVTMRPFFGGSSQAGNPLYVTETVFALRNRVVPLIGALKWFLQSGRSSGSSNWGPTIAVKGPSITHSSSETVFPLTSTRVKRQTSTHNREAT